MNKEDFLEKSHPLILPPHIRKTRGRPHTKILKKGDQIPKQMMHLCGNCGKSGHNRATFNNATDGQGHYMTNLSQDKCINAGFLVVPIALPGCTNLPQTLDEFNSKVKTSQYPWLPFHKMRSQDLPVTEVYLSQGLNDKLLTSDCESSQQSPGPSVTAEKEGDDESSIFSFSDDMSQYTLDYCNGKMSSNEMVKQKEHARKKMEQLSFLM